MLEIEFDAMAIGEGSRIDEQIDRADMVLRRFHGGVATLEKPASILEQIVRPAIVAHAGVHLMVLAIRE